MPSTWGSELTAAEPRGCKSNIWPVKTNGTILGWVNSPPILEPILVEIEMFTGGTEFGPMAIWRAPSKKHAAGTGVRLSEKEITNCSLTCLAKSLASAEPKQNGQCEFKQTTPVPSEWMQLCQTEVLKNSPCTFKQLAISYRDTPSVQRG